MEQARRLLTFERAVHFSRVMCEGLQDLSDGSVWEVTKLDLDFREVSFRHSSNPGKAALVKFNITETSPTYRDRARKDGGPAGPHIAEVRPIIIQALEDCGLPPDQDSFQSVYYHDPAQLPGLTIGVKVIIGQKKSRLTGISELLRTVEPER